MQAASFADGDIPNGVIGLLVILLVLGTWLLIRRRRAGPIAPSQSAATRPTGQAGLAGVVGAAGAVTSDMHPADHPGPAAHTSQTGDDVETGAAEAEATEAEATETVAGARVLWPFGPQHQPDPVSKPQRYRYDYSKPRQARKSHSANCPGSERPMPLDPFGAHLLAQRPDRPSMDPAPLFRSDRSYPTPDNTVAGSSDMVLRSQLIDLLAQSPADPVPVQPEVFFTGNADPTSLGLQRGGPSLTDVSTTATKIGNLKGVFEVAVLVDPLSRQDLDISDRWPRARQIRVLTSLDIEDVLLLVGDLDTIPWSDPAATYADGRPGPSDARAIYFGWR